MVLSFRGVFPVVSHVGPDPKRAASCGGSRSQTRRSRAAADRSPGPAGGAVPRAGRSVTSRSTAPDRAGRGRRPRGVPARPVRGRGRARAVARLCSRRTPPGSRAAAPDRRRGVGRRRRTRARRLAHTAAVGDDAWTRATRASVAASARHHRLRQSGTTGSAAKPRVARPIGAVGDRSSRRGPDRDRGLEDAGRRRRSRDAERRVRRTCQLVSSADRRRDGPENGTAARWGPPHGQRGRIRVGRPCIDGSAVPPYIISRDGPAAPHDQISTSC